MLTLVIFVRCTDGCAHVLPLVCLVVDVSRWRVVYLSQALRAACEERDNRISDLEVQALRNTSTLKMLSSALEVSKHMPTWLIRMPPKVKTRSKWSVRFLTPLDGSGV